MRRKLTYGNKKNQNKNSGTNPTSNTIFFLPLLFIIGILPFIMRLHSYHTRLSAFAWYPSNDSEVDIFLYYKQLAFLIVCVIMVLLLLYKLCSDKFFRKKITLFIPLFIYSTLALFSTLFSDYLSFGIHGIVGQFESIFVILGYCLLAYYAYFFINTENDLRQIFKVLLISILLMSVLAITQISGHDFLATEFGLKTYIPKLYWNQLDNFRFTMGLNRVYLTLYNPNYVGVYVALLAPIFISLLLVTRKTKYILLYILSLSGLFIALFGSQSDSGIIGVSVSLFFIILLFRKHIFKRTLIPILLIGTVIIIFGGFRITNLANLSNIFNQLKPKKVEYNLTDIRTEDKLLITYKGNELIVDYDGILDTNISISDVNKNPIKHNLDPSTGSLSIIDERFNGISITPVNYSNLFCVNVKIDGKYWLFTNQSEDGSFYYINSYGKFDKIIHASSAVFTGYENFASNRGYIWSRTLPLLKDNLFLGSGADTFAIVYPQQDYVYLSNAGFQGILLTKPHNMYFQIGIQSGVLSLVAFLVFYIIYFISSIRLYINNRFDNLFSQTGVSIFIGTISYMVVGIANDSSIVVAPLFWTLIGVGIACNYKVKDMSKLHI